MGWGELIFRNLRQSAVEMEPACGCHRGLWPRLLTRPADILLRGVRYCSLSCLEVAAAGILLRMNLVRTAFDPGRHRIPLGLLLLSRGHLTAEQLRCALDAQAASGRGRLGDHLETLGFASEQQITAALGLQWACPVLPQPAESPNCARLIPLRLLQHLRMLPICFIPERRLLHIAFSGGPDYAALHAVEQMLDCRTEACLTGNRALAAGLQLLQQTLREGELVFESCSTAAEIAHIASSYAGKLNAREVRIVACGEYIWIRLQHEEPTDLLFLKSASSLLLRENHSATKNP